MPNYVLKEPLPPTVAFPTGAYRLRIREDKESGRWQLFAEKESGNARRLLAVAANDGELMLRLHVSGLRFPVATIGCAIFEQLVRDGAARRLPSG